MKPNQARQAAARQMQLQDASAETIARYTQPRAATPADSVTTGMAKMSVSHAYHQRPPSASVFASSAGSRKSRVSLNDVFPNDVEDVPHQAQVAHAPQPASQSAPFGGATLSQPAHPARMPAPASYGAPKGAAPSFQPALATTQAMGRPAFATDAAAHIWRFTEDASATSRSRADLSSAAGTSAIVEHGMPKRQHVSSQGTLQGPSSMGSKAFSQAFQKPAGMPVHARSGSRSSFVLG